jgi:hypothetical protein
LGIARVLTHAPATPIPNATDGDATTPTPFHRDDIKDMGYWTASALWLLRVTHFYGFQINNEERTIN